DVVILQSFIFYIQIDLERCARTNSETFWCRVTTFMSGPSSGNWSLPEVDDEVEISLGRKFNTGDRPGLQDYSINILLENLTAGKVPNKTIETFYNYTGNNSYYGDISYSVETINNNTVNETYIYLKVETYEKCVDEDGNLIKKLLFTDIFKVKYTAINIDSSSGSSTVKEVIELVVDRII
ncbi:phage baseplate assembly protein V, partial [[Eubacterium] cellulosolvens]